MNLLEFPVLDERQMRDNYYGLPEEMLCEGLKIFLRDATNYKEIIVNSSLESEDVMLAFHSLKTMSYMIGAMQLHHLCVAFEEKSGLQKYELQKQFPEAWSKLVIAINSLPLIKDI